MGLSGYNTIKNGQQPEAFLVGMSYICQSMAIACPTDWLIPLPLFQPIVKREQSNQANDPVFAVRGTLTKSATELSLDHVSLPTRATTMRAQIRQKTAHR